MATARAAIAQDEQSDMLFIAMPVDVYKQLSDVAAQRNMTFSEALGQALSTWIATPSPRVTK